MKLNKILAAIMLIAAVAFAACEPIEPPVGPNGPGNGQDTTTVTPGDSTTNTGVAPDTTGWNIPAECLTVAQAREICAKLESGATTGTKYYVKGWVKKLASKHEEGVTTYGNAVFYIEDVKGANSQDDFEAYQVYGPGGSKITSLDQVLVGDYVVLYGELTNYQGTYETVGKGAAHIWKSTNPLLTGDNNNDDNQGGDDNQPTDVVGDGTAANPYTANDILLLANGKAGNYYVKAYIVGQVNGASISGGAEFNAPFSSSTNQSTGAETGYNTNLLLANTADETNPDNCVPLQLPSGALRTGLNLVQHPEMDGQEILVYGSLEKYFGTAGIKSPSYAKVGDQEFGTNPGGSDDSGDDNTPTNAILSETLLSQASFDKFTAISVKGDQVWTYDEKYGAKMSGYNGSGTDANEDWFLTPALDLTGKSSVTLTFDHAFGPAYAMPDTDAKKAQYTLWICNDYNGDGNVTAASWKELKGMAYGTEGWAYITSGEITIPAENLTTNCRIAWKYVCDTESSTWEIKNVVVQ